MAVELERLGAPASLVVQARLVADRICSPAETGAAVAALSRELTRLLDDARGAAQPASSDRVDELARKRDQKRRGRA